MRVLLLGGTTEASAMARALVEARVSAVYSYAGRTHAPVSQPLPTRVGGFGGVAGLRDYLAAERITHVIDATHPFARGMSLNAVTACSAVPLLRLERAPWTAQEGDNWIQVASVKDLPAALPTIRSRIFLAIGKQQIDHFASQPHHHYLLRLVDPPQGPLPLPDTTVLISRGPFTTADDTALMRDHNITHVVAKNAGGTGARAKLDAARALGLPVIVAQRPVLPEATTVTTPQDAMAWLAHTADLGV